MIHRHLHHRHSVRVYLAAAVLVSVIIFAIFIMAVPAQGATRTAEDLEGFSTSAAIASGIFMILLFTCVGSIGRLLFRHAERHGDPHREHDDAATPPESDLSLTPTFESTTLTISDTRRTAATNA